MNAQQLKNSILQEAIEGRLVPQDPNDEPASVLLDKIRKEKARLVKEGKLKKKDLEEIPINEDEKPFEIPESWEWVRFGDLVATSTGKTPARGDARYWSDNDFPWVSISDMKQGEIINSTKEFITEKAANDCFHNDMSKRGTLIMSFKLTVGRTSILGIDAFHNEAIISIKTYADKDNYTRDYLSYILPIITTWGDSKDAIKGKTLNAKSIYNLFIPLPPLAEQKRIVAKIEELMPKVEKYGKAQEALDKLNEELPDKLKKSVLQEAIEGRLVPQDPNDEPASVLLEKIRKEKARLVKEGKLKKKDLIETPISEEEIPFKIPESWEWCKLGNISEIARGGSPRPIKEYLTEDPNGLNWIKIGDTDKGGKYIKAYKEKIKPEGLKKTRMVHPGDFLLTNSMSFGRPYITNIEGCIHDGWLMISPYAGFFDQSYLYYVLSSAFSYKQFSNKVAGAVVQNLNSDKVADSIVPLPPLAEQKRIVEKIEQLMKEIDKLKV